MVEFTIGCDPEVMLEHEGELRSAIGIIKGTKYMPIPVEKGAIQHDNVMGEFNTEPVRSKNEFVEVLGTVLLQLAKRVDPLRIIVRASAEFPDSELKAEEARIFGCDPDYCAWKRAMIKVPDNAAGKSFRSAGGHLHVGTVDDNVEMLVDPFGKLDVIKLLDVIVGIPSLLLDKDPTSSARRSLYGRAGSHRPTDYGVEYRALGNYWISSPRLAGIIYELTAVSVEIASKGQPEVEKIIKEIGSGKMSKGERIVQDTINKSDLKMAKVIFKDVICQHLSEPLISEISKIQKTRKVPELYKEWGLK